MFDGEGCISISRWQQPNGSERYALTVAVQMVAGEPLGWLQVRWGGSIYLAQKQPERRRPTSTWKLENRNALPFLYAILPHLLIERVREKAALAIEFQVLAKAPRGGLGIRGINREAHRSRQRAYFEQMRELNRRGVRAEEAA